MVEDHLTVHVRDFTRYDSVGDFLNGCPEALWRSTSALNKKGRSSWPTAYHIWLELNHSLHRLSLSQRRSIEQLDGIHLARELHVRYQ